MYRPHHSTLICMSSGGILASCVFEDRLSLYEIGKLHCDQSREADALPDEQGCLKEFCSKIVSALQTRPSVFHFAFCKVH